MAMDKEAMLVLIKDHFEDEKRPDIVSDHQYQY